jgi:hypothetical protein
VPQYGQLGGCSCTFVIVPSVKLTVMKYAMREGNAMHSASFSKVDLVPQYGHLGGCCLLMVVVVSAVV